MGPALIDGCQEKVLIDSRARANAITPEYCVKHELKVRPVYELATSPTSIPVSGIGGMTSALSYTIINVQIPGVPSYNKEQIALVIQDVSGLGARVPIILGMPTIYRLCRQMKESEIGSVPTEWQHALFCYEAVQGVFLQSVTGCCVSVRDFEEPGMQTCIPEFVLLVHIVRQHGWPLRSCACIYHAVIMLSSHLAANQNKGVTCTCLGNQSGNRVIMLSNHGVTCKNVFMCRLPPRSIWLTNATILTILVPN